MNSSTEKKSTTVVSRPPIVVVMGHVDHGKTTLLDNIRKSRIAEREAGGITQSIGAYEVEKNGQRITFIDTPGHQAFSNMRRRGAHIADVAILIVAADDGVQPQTQEAIDMIKKSETPFVVAINKIDKNNADVERTKNSLLANGVLLEKYGGDVPWVAISAKAGTGIDELLDTVLLVAHMEDLTCDNSAPASGFIVESKMDGRRGITASAVITNGALHIGDAVCAGGARGKIKALEDFSGKRIDSAVASSPVLIVGFDQIPAAGEAFFSGAQELSADVLPALEKKEACPCAVDIAPENELRVILKGDVSGSLEALSQMIEHLDIEGKRFKIMSQEVGDITDGDVKLARTVGAKIVGFNVKATKTAELSARACDVSLITSNIIYRLVEALEEWVGNLYKKEMVGSLEVLATFSRKDKKQLVGGKMLTGFFTLNQKTNIVRKEVVLGQGRITNLQQGKADVKKVEAGECGIMIESPISIEVGDFIIVEK